MGGAESFSMRERALEDTDYLEEKLETAFEKTDEAGTGFIEPSNFKVVTQEALAYIGIERDFFKDIYFETFEDKVLDDDGKIPKDKYVEFMVPMLQSVAKDFHLHKKI